MCQKDKLEFKMFQVLRANDLSLVQKPFLSSFSFLFHNTFRWALIQILSLDAKIPLVQKRLQYQHYQIQAIPTTHVLLTPSI